mmetsp:Transcript_34482/g.108588  ORF Transcript_34482/g.108588 Transcript_34482/m.108588 type:complete len:280 (-) Transcript_34482:139-978(-)
MRVTPSRPSGSGAAASSASASATVTWKTASRSSASSWRSASSAISSSQSLARSRSVARDAAKAASCSSRRLCAAVTGGRGRGRCLSSAVSDARESAGRCAATSERGSETRGTRAMEKPGRSAAANAEASRADGRAALGLAIAVAMQRRIVGVSMWERRADSNEKKGRLSASARACARADSTLSSTSSADRLPSPPSGLSGLSPAAAAASARSAASCACASTASRRRELQAYARCTTSLDSRFIAGERHTARKIVSSTSCGVTSLHRGGCGGGGGERAGA